MNPLNFAKTAGACVAGLLALSTVSGLVAVARADAEGTIPADVTVRPSSAEKRPSGLVTVVLEAGTGQVHPDPNDVVEVHFVSYSKDGERLKTTEVAGEPASVPLARAFRGWSEGIQQMVVGERRRMWIPDHLGPKRRSPDKPWPAIMDVELLSIRSVPNPPLPLGSVPDDAARLPSGAKTKRDAVGSGATKPGPSSQVVVHYTLWTDRGRTVDSTHSRNRPAAFMLDRVMPAFSEGVQEMVLGEKRYIWVPAAAHGGEWPGSPQGNLIFHVELLRLLEDGTIQLKPPEEVDPSVSGQSSGKSKAVSPGSRPVTGD